jgi:hypothetical protein
MKNRRHEYIEDTQERENGRKNERTAYTERKAQAGREHNKTRQNRIKKNRTEQSRTGQDKTGENTHPKQQT